MLFRSVRDALVRDLAGFRRAVGGAAFRARFGGLTDDEPGVKLTRMPRGFAETHPAAEWLRFNSFTAAATYTDREMLATGFYERVMRDYVLMAPLCRWLNAALGYPPATSR